MTYFVLIDAIEMHTLIEAVNHSIRCHQKRLGKILHERIAKVKQGERNVIGWKADEHDELLQAIDRLDTLGGKLRALPAGKDWDAA